MAAVMHVLFHMDSTDAISREISEEAVKAFAVLWTSVFNVQHTWVTFKKLLMTYKVYTFTA